MIEFQCPDCGRPMKVADEHAGKTGKCKGCGNKVLIPSRSNSENTLTHPSTDRMRRPSTVLQATPVTRIEPIEAQTISCPFCDEPIAKAAKKCRHCGEFLDPKLRPVTLQQAVGQIQTPIQITNVNNVSAIANAGRQKRFSRLVSFLLSVLIPGLGQLYQGRFLVAVLWFVFTLIGYAAYIIPGIILHILCALSALTADPYR